MWLFLNEIFLYVIYAWKCANVVKSEDLESYKLFHSILSKYTEKKRKENNLYYMRTEFTHYNYYSLISIKVYLVVIFQTITSDLKEWLENIIFIPSLTEKLCQ